MRDDHDVIEKAILRLFSKKDRPLGWYAVEHSLTIPAANFPNGTNVMTFLEALEERGLIEATVNDKGQSAFLITTKGRATLDAEIEAG